MVLAIAAVPLVVIIEGFSHSEFLKTVDELDSLLRGLKFINLLPRVSCSQSIKELVANGGVPNDFELDILALNVSIVDVEGIVALHLGQVHETLYGLISGVTHGRIVSSLNTGVDARFVVRANVHQVKLVRHKVDVGNILVSLLCLSVN